MWKSIAVGGFLCCISAAVVLAQVSAGSAPATQPLVIVPPVHPIAVVTTWDELDKQEVIPADAGPIRLGIEAATAPAHGAVMVYARMDHINAAKVGNVTGDALLGPLMLRVKSVGMASSGRTYMMGDRKASDAPAFFAAAAVMGTAGECTVEVCDGGLVIARTKLVVGPEEALRWNPLSGGSGGAGSATVIQPLALDREPAVPWRDGSEPLPVPADGKLPRAAAPDKPSDDFKLSVEGQTFTIARWPGGAFLPTHQLLAAFYVNGKRYMPALRDPLFGSAYSGRTPQYDGQYRFRLIIDPVEVGGKPGDKVEMELLCCPQGLLKLNDTFPFNMGGGMDKPVVLSNRVVVTFPQ